MSTLRALEEDRKTKLRAVAPDTQQVCIDLPGEDIKCVVYKPKLEIMLRKHRDVIFDIQLFKGMTYTVEAEQSDFYNARDKKIVLRRLKQSVSFKDGERMHLWVSREFKGALILKSNGRVLGRYEPNTLDPLLYDADPKTKPAPLMVVMKNEPASHSQVLTRAGAAPTGMAGPFDMDPWTLNPVTRLYSLDDWAVLPRHKPSIPVAEEHPTVVVVDGSAEAMPKKLLNYFASGGGKSGLADIDTSEVATRNWLYGQLAGAAAYVGDNWNWLRHSVDRQADGAFKLVSAKVAYVRGKVRIYFAGYSANNPAFKPGGHGPGNAKILQIYAGIGKAKSAFNATAKAVAGTFKGNALVSFIFGSATAWAEWQADAQKDGYDFAASLLTGVVKAMLAAALATALVALILVVVMALAKVAVAALVVGALTLIAGFAFGYLVEAGDKALGKALKGPNNGDGTAASVAPWLRMTGQRIQEAWNYLSDKFPKDYQPWAAM